jgi:diguanylate cyclase (GGDEF)-like protein
MGQPDGDGGSAGVPRAVARVPRAVAGSARCSGCSGQVGSLYQRVGRIARIDALTGVHNRRVWDQELPRELARAARTGQPVCVALIDLDNFKAYNDQQGHQAGDRLLKAAAAVWRASLRKSDLLVRYGGEEFALLLPDCGLDDAIEIAERLRTSQPEGTCSIGVAAWDTKETEPSWSGAPIRPSMPPRPVAATAVMPASRAPPGWPGNPWRPAG